MSGTQVRDRIKSLKSPAVHITGLRRNDLWAFGGLHYVRQSVKAHASLIVARYALHLPLPHAHHASGGMDGGVGSLAHKERDERRTEQAVLVKIPACSL